MKTRQNIMETAKLADFVYSFDFLYSFVSSAQNVIDVLNNSFKMSDVEKRRAALFPCYLDNLYGSYTSLQTFLNFSTMYK